MIKMIIKKVFIVLLLLVMCITSSICAQPNLNQLDEKEHDFDNTYINLSIGPDLDMGGDVVVLGDSFAFLFCKYIDSGINYVVHQGYSINKINGEFLPYIKDHSFKYAFLLVGPNDFMEQTDIITFKNNLQTIITDLKSKGIKVILTDYCDPDYSIPLGQSMLLHPIKCFYYDFALKEVLLANGVFYVQMRDLLEQYGRMPLDPVHPAKELYIPLYNRLKKLVEYDKLANFG